MDELALKKGTVDRKKLVLKFSQNNFKALVNDCANEKELLAEFQRGYKWKFKLSSSFQISETKENIEKEKIKSDEIMFTMDKIKSRGRRQAWRRCE